VRLTATCYPFVFYRCSPPRCLSYDLTIEPSSPLPRIAKSAPGTLGILKHRRHLTEPDRHRHLAPHRSLTRANPSCCYYGRFSHRSDRRCLAPSTLIAACPLVWSAAPEPLLARDLHRSPTRANPSCCCCCCFSHGQIVVALAPFCPCRRSTRPASPFLFWSHHHCSWPFVCHCTAPELSPEPLTCLSLIFMLRGLCDVSGGRVGGL